MGIEVKSGEKSTFPNKHNTTQNNNKNKKSPFRIPLLVVFICQCLVVVGAFVAVILVLSTQQEKDFQSSINTQLQLRQERAREEFLGPIYKEEAVINNLAFNMAYNYDRKAILKDGVMDADELRDFWNDAYAALLECPRGDYIATYQASKVLTTSYGPYVNLAVLDPKTGSGLYTINQTYAKAFIALSTFPIPVFNSTYVYPTQVDNFSSISVLNPDFPLTFPKEWSPAGAILNPDTKQVTLSQAYTVSLYQSPRTDWPNNVTLHGVMIIVNMTTAVPMVQRSAVSPDSVAFLVENRQHSLLGGQVPFFAFDKVAGEPYYLPNTPDPIMNNAFIEVNKRCGANFESTCNSTVFRMKEGKEEYIVSAVRIQTDSQLNMLLIQYTKRSFFFDDFEANRARGIAIGVVAGVVVIVSSVLIWLAVVRPIRHLQEQMGHAAVMRNQEAADAAEKQGGSMLREMDALHISFVAMNNKLLQARPYLPQALLVSHNGSNDDEMRGVDQDNDDNDEGEDEEGFDDDNLLSMDVTSNGTMSMMMKGAEVNPTDQLDNLSSSRSPTASVAEDVAMETVPSTWRGAHSDTTTTPTTQSVGAGRQQLHYSDSILAPVSATTRRMAALVINAHGFHMATRNLSVAETGRLVASLVTAVEGAVRNERGIVDSFHGDHFTVSFNTARLVGAALKNAAVCALQVETAVRRQTPFKRVSMGLAGGRAMVGNMGNSNMMKLCALGPAYGQAVVLETVAQANLRRLGDGQEGSGCLVTESVSHEVELHVKSAFVGWTSLQIEQKKKQLDRTAKRKVPTPTTLAVLRFATSQDSSDEWMYALMEQNTMTKVRSVALYLEKMLRKLIIIGATKSTKKRTRLLTAAGVLNPPGVHVDIMNADPFIYGKDVPALPEVQSHCLTVAGDIYTSLCQRVGKQQHHRPSDGLIHQQQLSNCRRVSLKQEHPAVGPSPNTAPNSTPNNNSMPCLTYPNNTTSAIITARGRSLSMSGGGRGGGGSPAAGIVELPVFGSSSGNNLIHPNQLTTPLSSNSASITSTSADAAHLIPSIHNVPNNNATLNYSFNNSNTQHGPIAANSGDDSEEDDEELQEAGSGVLPFSKARHADLRTVARANSADGSASILSNKELSSNIGTGGLAIMTNDEKFIVHSVEILQATVSLKALALSYKFTSM